MIKINFPEVPVPIQGMDQVKIPRMYHIREKYEDDYIEDIEGHLRKKMDAALPDKSIVKGKRLALTVGSRGIPSLPVLVRTICTVLKDWGADPFIVPAMGSHGGGTAEGNLEVLASYGVTEESIGFPIHASMEVVQIGTLPDAAHTPVYCDKNAAEADGIIVFNKVKPHTDFKGQHESGLCKMMAIGLAKHKGCSWFHMQGFETFPERIPMVAEEFLAKKNVVLGIGVVQNAYDKISEIEAFPKDKLMEGDHMLLEIARRRLPKMKFDNIDVLIIDRIGKNISGEGADPNVTGRSYMPEYFKDDFHCQKLFIRGVTEESHHNACGISLADVTTRRVLNDVDWVSTWINLTTNTMIDAAKIPFYRENDKEALEVAIRTCNRIDYSKPRVARIRDTLSLGDIEISEEILPDVQGRDDVEIVEGPYEMQFDEKGFFCAFCGKPDTL